MSHAPRLLVAFTVVCMTSACTTRIDVRLDAITRENVPAADVSSPAFLGIRDSVAHKAGEYIVVRFTTSRDIAKDARDRDIGLVVYSLFPCGSETHVHTGDMYPVNTTADGYEYMLRIPPEWAKLGWRKPSGELATGWPANIATSGLCMKISGANMLGDRLSTDEISVDEVRRLLR